LAPTGLGERVADYLAGVVPDLLDAGFTARMEADLDKIADKHGGMSKVTLLEKFYGELQAAIARASAAAASDSAAASDAGSDSAATPTKRRGAAKKAPAGPTVLREFAGGVRAVETRYGPALLVGGGAKAKGRFVGLSPFMAWRGAELSEVSEADVARLAELPDEIAGADGWALAIGQYGLYLKRDRENRRLPEALWEEAWAGRLSGEAALGVLDAPVSPASPKRFTKKRSGVKRKV